MAWVLMVFLAGQVMQFDYPSRDACLAAHAEFKRAQPEAILACTTAGVEV